MPIPCAPVHAVAVEKARKICIELALELEPDPRQSDRPASLCGPGRCASCTRGNRKTLWIQKVCAMGPESHAMSEANQGNSLSGAAGRIFAMSFRKKVQESEH